jgi:hypothetical protein
VKQLRVAEVLAVRLVKAFHLLWSWFGCPGNHLIGHPLQPELALNLLAQLAILECCAAVACHFLPLDGLLEGARVDGPGIVGRGLFEQQSVDGRVLRRSPQAPPALGFIGNCLPPRIASDALGFPADRLVR